MSDSFATREALEFLEDVPEWPNEALGKPMGFAQIGENAFLYLCHQLRKALEAGDQEAIAALQDKVSKFHDTLKSLESRTLELFRVLVLLRHS